MDGGHAHHHPVGGATAVQDQVLMLWMEAMRTTIL